MRYLHFNTDMTSNAVKMKSINFLISPRKFSGYKAGILSSANDMAQWIKMLLEEGLNRTEVTISGDVISETRKPVNAYTSIDPQEDPFLPPKYVRFLSQSNC